MKEYDTKILGDGSIGAGKYNNIKIMGNGTTLGDIECLDIKVMGNGEFRGKVDARKVKVMGDSTFYYDIKVKENIKILGDMTLEESLTGKYIKILGDLKVKKNLIFDEVNVLGAMKILGNCEGNYFYNKGEVIVEGLLSADKIEIEPRRFSRIEEIGGSEIIIKKSGWFNIMGGKVSSKLIEGDTIILQNTTCNIVRGHNVTILDGCFIDKIEYTGNLKVDKKSKIGEEICLKN